MTLNTPRVRRIVWLTLISLAVVLLILGINIGGSRDRIMARLGVVYNPPSVVTPPAGFLPQVPSGFKVSIFARGFEFPRWLATAPNGDVFVAESTYRRIVVLQDPNRLGHEESRFSFAENLHQPFGIAFHGAYVY